MKKIFAFPFFFLCLFFLFQKPTFAASNPNFTTAAHVTYTVNSSGVTHAVFSITLKNTTSMYYASSYTMHLGFSDMENVTGFDNGGAITPDVKTVADGKDISMTFNKKAVGLNATLPFQFSFDTKDIASLNGSIWEVNIPGLSNDADFTDFTVEVVVPSYFGKPTYMKPDVNSDGSLTFTKEQLGKSGISLAFGDKQAYSFHLLYHVRNN